MDALLDTLPSGIFEGPLALDSNVWTYVLIAAITIVVLFYGTRYVFTGVNVTSGSNDNIPYKRCNVGNRAAVVSMKGHRQYMEDTYQAVPSFGGRDNWSFYGVFDGHGGARCSVYVAHFLYKHVWSCIDLYLEHNSLNSANLWKLLLNDENLVSYEINNNENNNNNNDKSNNNNNNNKKSNSNTNTNNTKIRNDDKLNNNENEKNNQDKILKTNENNENLINKSNTNNSNEDTNETSNNSKNSKKGESLTSDNVDQLDEAATPLLNNKNNSEFRPKSSSMTTITQRGSDVSDSEFESNINNKNKDKKSKRSKIGCKLIGIPKYVDEIMREALIQSHRYADKEFLALANRQQWQDGSTAISCVILPAKDILHALMNEERNGVVSDTSSNSSNDPAKQRQRELYSLPSNSSSKLLDETNNNSSNNINNNNNNNNGNKISSYIKNNLKIDDICDDKDTWMFISNTGDSRAILVTKSGTAISLSTDHKPNRMDERRRIEEKGGRVVFFGVWRVEGVLAVSRAFGDRRLKRWVIPDPEILSRKIEENDMFMILASDGVWDAVSNEQAARYAHEVWNDDNYKNSDLKSKLQAIAAKISSMAFRLGSMDNITALVVHLPSHCTYGISGSLRDLNLNNE